MNIKITGKELKATDAIKNYIDTKSERLEKYFDTEDIDLFVTIYVSKKNILINAAKKTASNDADIISIICFLFIIINNF